MAIIDRITRAWARFYNTSSGRPKQNDWNTRQVYEMLEAYYMSNGVYDALVDVANADIKWARSMLELKNPTFAVVEFYAKKIWPGTLPDTLKIKTDNNAIIEPIEQIWQWSNWGAKKTVAARYAAMYGDLFIRVSTAKNKQDAVDRVYLQIVNPRNVTDFLLDERGYITFLRYDVRRKEINDDGSSKSYWHTEVWTKENYRRWDNAQSAEQSIASLGTPKETLELSALGIDFVPWVHAPFLDTSDTEAADQRGMAPIWPCITKIDHLHLCVARLGQLLFRYNRPTWAVLANSVDKDGRPMPAPKKASYDVDLDGEDWVHLPGMADIKALIPNLNYEAHAAYIADLYNALKTDLPELRYYDVMEARNESGIALAHKLQPAVDRVVEVRGSLESALIRAQQMALTIGSNANLFSVGTYDNGDFDHSLKEREVFPHTALDIADMVKTYVDAKVPITTALREFAGWSDEKLADMQRDMNIEGNVAAVPQIAALPKGLPPETQADAQYKAKDALAKRTEGTVAGALNDIATNASDSMLKSGALAKVLEKNQEKQVRK